MTLRFESVYNEGAATTLWQNFDQKGQSHGRSNIHYTQSRFRHSQLAQRDKIDPANIVGMINQGTRLEYVTQTGSWYVGKVYVSTQGAEAVGNQFIKPKAFNDFVNIRTSPVVENNTDVGDLKQGQQMELIAPRPNGWWARSICPRRGASWSPKDSRIVVVPMADGFDAPIGSPQERASTQVWPGAWFDATPSAVSTTQPATWRSIPEPI